MDNAPVPEAPATPPPPPPAPAVATPKSRRWFVVLAWVALVAFGIFVAGITIVTACIPQIKKMRDAGR